MTSKEALKKLEAFTNWSSDEDIDKNLYNLWGNVACRIIKKDLEALNIFRKAFEEHLFYLYDYSNACGECYILMIDADEGSSIKLTKQEDDLLKEVLGDNKL